MGHTEAALAASREAVILDPLNTESHRRLGEGQWVSRRYREAVVAFEEAIIPEDLQSPFPLFSYLKRSTLSVTSDGSVHTRPAGQFYGVAQVESLKCSSMAFPGAHSSE